MKAASGMEWSDPGGAQRRRIPWGRGAGRKREIQAADSITMLMFVCVRETLVPL